VRLIQAGSATGTHPATNSGTTTNPQVNRTAISQANLNNNFYWGSTSLLTTLPVTLVSFTGQQIADQINLRWETASEKNFDYFSLEKSLNGSIFFEISKLPSHGTTNQANVYRFDDSNPIIGKNYYRLKSVDFDGYLEYFDIISIDYSTERQFNLYPNPTDGKSITAKINFQLDQEYSITIFNSFGVPVGKFSSIQPEVELSFTDSLPTGVYFAKFSSLDFNQTTRFLVGR
jgi:hypothetical protein